MKIYTKQGDEGKTQVYNKEPIRLDKHNLLLETYGTLDEVNAHLGLISSQLLLKINDSPEENPAQKVLTAQIQYIESLQKLIFKIGFAFSDQGNLHEDMLHALEDEIDKISAEVAPQTKFILPGGSELAANVHIARTVARRAERTLVALKQEQEINPLALAIVNRMSDYLFVLARLVNLSLGVNDIEV